MKSSKLVNMLAVLIILFAVIPAQKGNAEVIIGVNTIISTDTTFSTDIVITSGATLTINPGVVISVACSDSDPYHGGVDSHKVEIIVENGNLIADRVTFQGETTNSCWHGIRILDSGDATITRSKIRDARIGVEIYRSAPEVSGNIIESIRGEFDAALPGDRTGIGILVSEADSGLTISNNTIRYILGGNGPLTSDNMDGGAAYGIFVTDTDDLTLQNNRIEDVTGGDAGWYFFDGTDGASGTIGTSENPDGGDGGNGSSGKNGGHGGDAAGIHIISTSADSVTLTNNTITEISAGDGNRGTFGGDGGNGGIGYTAAPTSNGEPINGGNGGTGGIGGNGGSGGDGGNAYGIRTWNVTASMTENEISVLRGGQAGIAGPAGSGGAGGSAGYGSVIYLAKVKAGFGGTGGDGGISGLPGLSGNGGSSYGVAMDFGSLTHFSGNSIKDLLAFSGAAGSPGASGGNGGAGGNGGSGNSSYLWGGGGGNGGNAAPSGMAGDGGNGGSVYGLFMQNITVSDISANKIAKMNAGIGGVGGNAWQGTRNGGNGGSVGDWADLDNPSIKGGDGGLGGAGGKGGNGGIAGFAFGIFGSGVSGNPSVVNNILYDIYAPSGGNGGNGGPGGEGGRGGSGSYPTGSNEPGGNGGNGGAAGYGGDGGQNVFGLNLFNAGAVSISSSTSPTKSWTFTNNTIAIIFSNDSNPNKGLKGTPGAGGIAGVGTPSGTDGATGAVSSDGSMGVMGQSNGFYAGPYISASFYNNIVSNLLTPVFTNTTGVFKHPDGVVTTFSYGNVFGWQKNYGDSLVGIDKTGSINVDPQFSDYMTENYHLQSTSPCIDSGSNSSPSVPAVDLDGVVRPFGTTVDMGAYEYDGTVSEEYLIFIPMILR
jgi:hypothetical protein